MSWQSIGAWSVLTAMVFAGCGDSLGLDTQEHLAGSWNWVESSGGIAGVTLTPASTGETMTLRFPSAGLVELIRNGAFVRSSTYTLTPVLEEDSFGIEYEPPLLGFETQTGTLLRGDTLVLADGCCDGFVYRWVRAR
ncbi:MAG: hypothetical protein O2958_09285 [Gemmatimonadetes bacterium]|nr:hypothetical protein [Gemmatimonadota bacterium]MDA1103502.1 hypothetical protein [Gemmatimonadota bacterium]